MRRRVDLRRLPAPARYAVALAVLAVVIAIVLLVGPGTGRPAGWYSAVVSVGAVALLVYLAGRLLWWLRGRLRRQPPGS
ncbi:hypothetical protein ACWEGE_32960 [Amycolatopsis sp. NPDC004747]